MQNLNKSELKTLELALQNYYGFCKNKEGKSWEKELEHINQVKKTLKI